MYINYQSEMNKQTSILIYIYIYIYQVDLLTYTPNNLFPEIKLLTYF